MAHVLYECGICSSLHPWDWNGDCREDAHRYADEEEYAEAKGISIEDIEILSWEDRCEVFLQEAVLQLAARRMRR